jgi:Conjugative transposon protein TraO.
MKVKGYDIKFNDITFNAGYFTSVYSTVRDKINFNAGGGLVAGYEAVNNGSELLSSGAIVLDKSKFIYGLFGSLESEIYLNNEWTLMLKYNQFLHLNSDLGKWTPFIGVGARYFLF